MPEQSAPAVEHCLGGVNVVVKGPSTVLAFGGGCENGAVDLILNSRSKIKP